MLLLYTQSQSPRRYMQQMHRLSAAALQVLGGWQHKATQWRNPPDATGLQATIAHNMLSQPTATVRGLPAHLVDAPPRTLRNSHCAVPLQNRPRVLHTLACAFYQNSRPQSSQTIAMCTTTTLAKQLAVELFGRALGSDHHSSLALSTPSTPMNTRPPARQGIQSLPASRTRT